MRGTVRAGLSDGATKARLGRIIAHARQQDLTSTDLVLAAMREAILSGVLPPATRLRQEKLAGVFGTSRIPVRDALRSLEYEGLVTSEPYRGFAVTQLDADDIDEVYDLRILLESHAVRLAIPLITDEDLRVLDELYAEMTTAAPGEAQLTARERFYLRLYTTTAHPRLVNLIVRLRQEIARSLRWPTLQHAPDHHAAFYEAVRAGDAERAVSQLANHYRRVAILIRRYLRGETMADRRENGATREEWKSHATGR